MSGVSIPEVLETDVGESIIARSSCIQSWKELGPPDLVQVTKQIPKTKDNGTYHYVTGVDTSSSASIAAYLNTLMFSLGESQVWFGKHPGWKVSSGVYCTFNAFSRIDVRVSAEIPGSIKTWFLTERGEVHQNEPLSDQQWDETFMSAMLRSLIYCDDDVFHVSCCRRLNPLTKEAAGQFFGAFERLFELGPALGSVTHVQVPTLTSNYLVDGFFKFVEVTGMFDLALECVENLMESMPEVAVLKARLLLLKHQEVDAVKTMCEGIAQSPRDPDLLELQGKFCKDKKRLDLALDCAIRAVNSSPSEFVPWETLVQVYTARGDFEQALLSLNSCPMFHFHDLDSHRMPAPNKVHLPLPSDGVLDEVWAAGNQDPEQDSADPDLLKLPAPTLRATFAKAYDLLTEIVSHIGWDKLLKARSHVFVMEEEYRKEARKGSATSVSDVPNGDSTSDVDKNDDDASTTAILGKPSSAAKGEDEHPTPDANGAATELLNGVVGDLKNKRLCERWLDNLFMVLYDDLRVYTVWRSNYVQYKSQQIPYSKSALEWEILGMVAYRLKHKEEAIDAFQQSLRQRFSHRVLWKLLEYQRQKGNPDLDIVVKLTAWNHRWYCDFSPKLMMTLRAIVAKEGLTKVENSVSALYNGQGVVSLLTQCLKTLKTFNADGTDS